MSILRLPPARPVKGRRDFLCAGALSLIAVAVGPARVRAAATGPRRVRMLNTHTGERIDTTYFEDGALVPGALAELDRFLRDFRTGDVRAIDPGVLDIAWSLSRAAHRPLGTIEIVSGYRSPETNAALRKRGSGVASHSLHLEGKALDEDLWPSRGVRRVSGSTLTVQALTEAVRRCMAIDELVLRGAP